MNKVFFWSLSHCVRNCDGTQSGTEQPPAVKQERTADGVYSFPWLLGLFKISCSNSCSKEHNSLIKRKRKKELRNINVPLGFGRYEVFSQNKRCLRGELLAPEIKRQRKINWRRGLPCHTSKFPFSSWASKTPEAHSRLSGARVLFVQLHPLPWVGLW